MTYICSDTNELIFLILFTLGLNYFTIDKAATLYINLHSYRANVSFQILRLAETFFASSSSIISGVMKNCFTRFTQFFDNNKILDPIIFLPIIIFSRIIFS